MPSWSLYRSALSISLAAAFLVDCGAPQAPGSFSSNGAAPLAKHVAAFGYTGAVQSFVVPHGVKQIRVIAVGANGAGDVPAQGGRVSAVVPVTPSETLAIYVGGAASGSNGGFNGGGNGGLTGSSSGEDGSGGGGASDVREGGSALKDRIIVAGGAGGAGAFSVGSPGGLGGRGGGLKASSGRAGCCKRYQNGGGGGGGGTQRRGGAGGPHGVKTGANGTLGLGGAGASGCDPGPSCGYQGGGGGGGGGGYYGGGGGGGGSFYGCCGSGGGGGAGGGSSYAEKTASDVHMWRGWREDQFPIIILRW